MAASLFLMNPSTILIVLPWVGWITHQHRAVLKKSTVYCSVVLGVLLLAAAAWGARNRYELGAFVIRTNLGMTLYASDNDCASSSLIASEMNDCYQAHHPNTSIDEARLLSSMGEVQYDRFRVASAKAWMRDHPGTFLRLTIARFRDFWFPVPSDFPYKSAVIWVATILSIPGLVLMIRRREKISVFIVTVLTLYPLMYYVVVSDVRYRLPVLWLSLLPAGSFIVQLWDGRQRLARKSH
jgi:hypothetical protein